MTRKEFLELAGTLGIGLPFLPSCNLLSTGSSLQKSDKVIIIGAGAAGLTAAHLLKQQGIEIQVLEAGGTFGGRMKRTTEFADFPIPVGAEWLHSRRSIFDEIVNDPNILIDIKTTPYDFNSDYGMKNGQKVSLKELGFTIDQKFIGSTWFDFYAKYIVPSIENKIKFNEAVVSINYSLDEIVVQTKDTQYTADKVIITVPVKLLQLDTITFNPPLPNEKKDAIRNVTVWGGCKGFLEFTENFYPTAIAFDEDSETAGHRLYYDAAYGQNSKQHILGLFAVGSVADPYLNRSSEKRIAYILSELDDLFDGKASKYYKKFMFQNWTEEPFARGAYVHYFEGRRTFRNLSAPVDHKLYFAGDAYTDGSDWSSVHAAAQSAVKAVRSL